MDTFIHKTTKGKYTDLCEKKASLLIELSRSYEELALRHDFETGTVFIRGPKKIICGLTISAEFQVGHLNFIEEVAPISKQVVNLPNLANEEIRNIFDHFTLEHGVENLVFEWLGDGNWNIESDTEHSPIIIQAASLYNELQAENQKS